MSARLPLLQQPRAQRVLYPVLVGVVLVALWQGLVTAMELPPYLVPSPWLMMKTLVADWVPLGLALLVTQPDLLLMDEPFGALDEITRHKLDAELLELWRRKKLTVIFVTHSIHEAVFLSSRVIMMAARPGRVVEEFHIDEPYPRSADFMVSPQFSRYAKQLQDSLLRASSGAQEEPPR